ncbi:MAG: hypothetical protein LC808_24205 [Actinobacteria bacterium]|nr:hypothetical protein [Actinomycetota bacterium]
MRHLNRGGEGGTEPRHPVMCNVTLTAWVRVVHYVAAGAARSTLAGDQPREARQMGSTFGDTVRTSSATLVMDVSADGKAFTGTFADFQVEANNGAGAPAPMAARWEWLMLPLADAPQGDSITVSVSGHVITDDAARGTLVISVNGQATVTGFPPKQRRGVRAVGPLPDLRV